MCTKFDPLKLTNPRHYLSAKLKKAITAFQQAACADAKAPVRVKAVNTLLNSGYNLRLLDDKDVEKVWESLFYALWYAEMGRGCEEIIAAIERACINNTRLTRVGFTTISKKWYGLDQYRVDKVSHLARHLLPVLLNQQIKIWLKNMKTRKLGTQNVVCKQLLRKTLDDVVESYGLCYFLLEILADEMSTVLTRTYERLHITVGKFELKANLIVFLYKQVIGFTTNTKLDARLLRTFDQYVIKRFITELLPNEAQLTQILVSLRLHQALDVELNDKKKSMSGKCRTLFQRWSMIIKEIHENSINGEYFPTGPLPIKGSIKWSPRIE